jgi:hypothetical protein
LFFVCSRFWIDSKLAELGASICTVSATNPYRFATLPGYYPLVSVGQGLGGDTSGYSTAALASAYQSHAAEQNPFGFAQDGLLFYNKNAQYAITALFFSVSLGFFYMHLAFQPD